MAGLAAHKLQEVIFDALVSNTDLNERVSAIYDQVTPNASYPYVAMGETSMVPLPVKDRSGSRVTFDVVVWSSEPSQMEVKELMALVDKVLHDGSPEGIGFELVQIRLQNAGVVRQFNEEGSLYRGRLTYVAVIYT